MSPPNPSCDPRLERRLAENLEYLGLRRIAEIYAKEAERASRESVSPEAFLDRLVAAEAAARFERAVKNRVVAARFPCIKTLDTFDFTAPTKINRQQVQRLHGLDFVSKKTNAILIGNPGVGKTHLALALGYEACRRGLRVRFAKAVEATHELAAAAAQGNFISALRRFTRPDLLVLDELGYLPIDKRGADLLFQIFSARYEVGSLVVTTNRPFKQWGKIFNHDNVLAAAVVDRVAQDAEIVVIEGDSYRMKVKS